MLLKKIISNILISNLVFSTAIFAVADNSGTTKTGDVNGDGVVNAEDALDVL